MTTSKRTWETYPAQYRNREIRILADWIRAGESGSLIGLAGAGKSNLLGYLTHQPEAIAQHVADTVPKLALVHIDLNNLTGHDLATFYRVMLRSLSEAEQQLTPLSENLPLQVEILYRKVEDKTDPFLSQSALRELLFLFKAEEIRLVFVLDPFDQFCQATSTQVLDTIRGLRDGFKATLSYIVGLRRELAYLRAPEELGELYELLDLHTCWLGAMEANDARWVINQVETAAGCTFTLSQVKQLISVTGGYPALLRAASLWLVNSKPNPPHQKWAGSLLSEPAIQNRLRELWQGLTSEEQSIVALLQTTQAIRSTKERQEGLRQISHSYQSVLTQLQLKKICIQDDNQRWRIFSPLFTHFIGNLEGINTGKIWRSNQQHFYRGDIELGNLTSKDRLLLNYFLDKPRLLHSIDELAEAGWPRDEAGGVSTEAVQQAIRHLRTRIEPNPGNPAYLIVQHGAGYRFFPEGRPG